VVRFKGGLAFFEFYVLGLNHLRLSVGHAVLFQPGVLLLLAVVLSLFQAS
jgi:hypothetical protein